jgi:hypothetical protein
MFFFRRQAEPAQHTFLRGQCPVELLKGHGEIS